jgi:hypothetical protein
MLSDFHRMVPSLPACTVLCKAVRLFDAQLPSEDRHNAGWGLRQILRERPEVTSGAQLHCEAKPVVIATAECDEAAVVVVKMKVASEIFWRGLTVKSAIPPPLLIR